MKHERDGRLRSARASVASFPPAEEMPERQPSHADASHVARRRASSAPAHEVNLDEIELVDGAPLASVPIVPPAIQPRAPFEVPTTDRPPPPKRATPVAWIAIAVVLSAVVGGGLALFTRSEPPRAFTPSSPAAATPAQAPVARSSPAVTADVAPSPPVVAPAVPLVDVAALPRPHVGTVLGSPGHRLWIDGTLAPSWQATVTCGPHVVQVGSAGATRDVDVPCGAEVNVQP